MNNCLRVICVLNLGCVIMNYLVGNTNGMIFNGICAIITGMASFYD